MRDPSGTNGHPGCLYITGTTNVAKLNGSALINDPAAGPPVLTNAVVHPPAGGKITVDAEFAGVLSSRSTFLTFGLMPTTATMDLTQSGRGGIVIDIASNTATATMDMRIRLRDTVVDGQPMDVGAHCESVTPAHLVLTGHYNNPLKGGLLSGSFTIPAFHGCGSGRDDLDSLLTRAISGPGNLTELAQGEFCNPTSGNVCPPPVPAPPR